MKYCHWKCSPLLYFVQLVSLVFQYSRRSSAYGSFTERKCVLVSIKMLIDMSMLLPKWLKGLAKPRHERMSHSHAHLFYIPLHSFLRKRGSSQSWPGVDPGVVRVV